MAIPADNGLLPYFWNEDGILIARATDLPVLNDVGEPISWVEPPPPEPEPDESIPYLGPPIWAVTASRLGSSTPSALFWVEAEDEAEARFTFLGACSGGMTLETIERWFPISLAQYRRWRSRREGNLAALITRS